MKVIGEGTVNEYRMFCLLAAAAFAVQACGSGSGIREFTSWDDIGPGETVVINGRVVYADFETNGQTNLDASRQDDAQVQLDFDDASDLERVSVDVDQGFVVGIGNPDVEFNANDGADIGFVFGDIVGGAISASGEEVGLVADPTPLGFNYQTFGVWLTGFNTGAGVAAAGSFGSMTPEASVPGAGEATYNGAASGYAVDASGTPFFVVSDAMLVLDFDAADLDFTFETSNSMREDLSDGFDLVFVADADFDLDGAGAIVGNSLTGNVETTGYDMAGTIDAWIYGPGGEEVGGLFDLEGDDGRYLGSFGAVD